MASFGLVQNADKRVLFFLDVWYLMMRWESSPVEEVRKLMTLLREGDVMFCDLFISVMVAL